MSSTVDNICDSIEIKFNSIRSILCIYNNYELDTDDSSVVSTSLESLKILYDTHTSATLDILSTYYNTDEFDVKKIARDNLAKSIKANNIIGELDRLYKACQRLKKIYKIDDVTLPSHHKDYENSVIDESFIDPGSDVCTHCKIPYEIEEKTAEYICKNCGRLEKMSGVVFEDDQFFYQEGQRTKHGKYDPIKHAKLWLERIQAKETTDIPVVVLNAIKSCIKRDQLWLDRITCDVIRKYLKQIKKTQFNNHVPLIRKLVTGKEPSQLTEHETQLVYMYLGIAVHLFAKIKKGLAGSVKNDCPYHPYFIYKIIEQILNKPKDELRKRDILSCIHLQSRETLIEHDRAWFAICSYIPEFKKVATNNNRGV
jgi:hypothetical protein